MAVTYCGCAHIQEEIYCCWYLNYSLGFSELGNRNAVGVLVKIFGTLDMTQLTRKSGINRQIAK